MHKFDTAGIAVYALSYDEPDALKDFKEAHDITYTLLSDPESEVIGSFGILNTLIDANDHPWFGIPYPGTYVIDREGVITHKFFDSNLAVRAGPEQLLRAAQGGSIVDDAIEKHLPEAVTVAVEIEGETLTSTVQRDLVVRFDVPEGRHVYADPAPDGSVAVQVEVDSQEGLVTRDLLRPQSEPHTLLGAGEKFQVHHGSFELRLPLTTNSLVGDKTEITVSGKVRWQSCDDEVCDIPSSQDFLIVMPIVASPPTALGSEQGAKIEPNAMAHFQKMTSRRQS